MKGNKKSNEGSLTKTNPPFLNKYDCHHGVLDTNYYTPVYHLNDHWSHDQLQLLWKLFLILVRHPNPVLRGQCLTSVTEVGG